MNFTEPIFGLFIVVVMIGLAAVRRKVTAIWLIIASSTVFYGWWNATFLLLIAAATFVDFYLARFIGGCTNKTGKKLLLVISICWNLGLLFYFKYTNFLVDSVNLLFAATHIQLPHLDHHNIVLPVGISFFTFETLCYSIDVYRGDFKPIKKLSHFLLFISFFPHLVAGPIVRAKDFLPQVEGNFPALRDWTGLFLIIFGLGKKMLLADPLGQLVVDPTFAAPHQYGTVDLVFAVYCYSLQIFLDFSGYTDIAIGLARLMGFNLGINFNAPYIARSFSEFWRRWHISLSTWFRDYVFIPLGGSRVGSIRLILNLMIVFLASGLWHGANWRFLVWGGLNGLFLVGEVLFNHWVPGSGRTEDARWTVLGALKALMVFNLISFAWIFFRAEHWESATGMIRRIATADPATVTLANGAPLALFMAAILLHISVEPFKERAAKLFARTHVGVQAGLITLLCAVMFNQALQRVGHKAFIYFQF